MSVLQIRHAHREGARVVIGFSAPTGQGKTYTAIMFGYGLANYDASKLGFMDTENKRGSLYADILRTTNPPTDTPFLLGDLVAPFSPQRYTDGILEFQKAGVEVLIIDSITHEHEGPGGLLEIASDGKFNPNKYWNRAKTEHKKFVNALLQSDMHIIVCCRAREKSEPTEVIDDDGKKKKGYRDLGLHPITEKNLFFEMTASLMMFDEGRRQETMKMPAALRPYLGRLNGYITPQDGKAVRDWVDGARQLDPLVEKYKNRLLTQCEQGVAHLDKCWGLTPKQMQDELGEEFHKVLVASATAYDKARVEAETDPTPDPTVSQRAIGLTAAAITAAAAAGRASVQAQQTAQTPQADPPVQMQEAPKNLPPARAQSAPAVTASTPAANVTPLRAASPPAAAAPDDKRPLAVPEKPKKPAINEPMF